MNQTEWLRNHERDLSRMKSLLRLLGCDVHIDTNGVVPVLAFDGPEDEEGTFVQVYMLSARANNELSGRAIWTVGAMYMPSGDDIEAGEMTLPSILSDSPAGRLILLDAFVTFVSRYIQDATVPRVVGHAFQPPARLPGDVCQFPTPTGVCGSRADMH